MTGTDSTLVATGIEDKRYRCIFTLPTGRKGTDEVSGSAMAGSLYDIASDRLSLIHDTFGLVIEHPEQGALSISQNDTALLEALMGTHKKVLITVEGKDGVAPMECQENEEQASSKRARTSQSGGHSAVLNSINNMGLNSNTSVKSSSSYSYNAKSLTGFVGLSNQGATCYLNSLLQTLFMTPEFRNAVFKWQRGDEEMERNIPLELQKLFALLSTSSDRSLSTTAVTKSFGWDRAESYQQHDVQELLRVLFEALGKRWGDEVINDLYQGEMEDYVQCKVCGYKSKRVDKFLDVPLVLKPFGSTVVIKSVEEGLEKFVETELLEGDNQYFCEKCDKKSDALKGLRFTKFPYLLTLQLKRFDFDYTTMRRIKLNERMSFPFVLDLNSFISEDEAPAATSESPSAAEDGEVKPEAAATAGAANSDPGSAAAAASSTVGPADWGPGSAASTNIGAGKAKRTTRAGSASDLNDILHKAEGPYVYQLFSVMIHSGSAIGGHYYAYIMSFENGKWYKFDDSSVSEISKQQVEMSFGGAGTTGGYSSMYSGSMSAYMLIYRRVDADKNEVAMSRETMPEHVQAMLQEIQEAEQRKKEEAQLAATQTTVSVFFQATAEGEVEKKEVAIAKKATVGDLLALAKQAYAVDDATKARLRKYSSYQDQAQEPLNDSDTLQAKSLAWATGSVYLERANEKGEFPSYDVHDITLDAFFLREHQKSLQPARRVTINKKWTTKEAFKSLAVEFGVANYKELRVASASTSTSIATVLWQPNTELVEAKRVYPTSTKLYVDAAAITEKNVPWKETSLSEAVEALKNSIELEVFLPDAKAGQPGTTVKLDQRVEFGKFKRVILSHMIKLEPEDFQVVRAKNSYSDIKQEISALSKSMKDCMGATKQIWLKPGKPLEDGQKLMDVWLLRLNHEKPLVPFMTLPVKSPAVTKDTRQAILAGFEKKKAQEEEWEFQDIALNADRLRLRKLNYNEAPRDIYLDEDEIEPTYQAANLRAVIQLLDEPEVKATKTQLVLLVRRWRPAEYSLDPFFEILIEKTDSAKDLAVLLAKKSGIPAADIRLGEVPYGQDFPYEMPRAELPKMRWYQAKEVQKSRISDGEPLFFKDGQEKLKDLSSEERAKSLTEDRERCKTRVRTTVSRKEKALKIYDADSDKASKKSDGAASAENSAGPKSTARESPV